MDYIAVLDYQHLDNGVFLSAFAKSLASQTETRALILHGDSEYTERLIQTGMMRNEAKKRAIKDLNHRLIALFADYGIAATGLNAYQRSLVSTSGETVSVDKEQLHQLPSQPHLLISNLVHDTSSGEPIPLSLELFTAGMASKLSIKQVFVFSLNDSDEIIKNDRPEQISLKEINEEFAEKYIPGEFREIQESFQLTTARDFGNYPTLKNTTTVTA